VPALGHARSQVLMFGVKNTLVLGWQDFCFYYMFETNLSGQNKIWGSPKRFWRKLLPNAPHGYGTALGGVFAVTTVVSKHHCIV